LYYITSKGKTYILSTESALYADSYPNFVSITDIERARETIRGITRHTPLMTSPTISSLCRADLSAPDEAIYLKAENLQRTGSFKIRGAYNRLAQIPSAERGKGVVTASAGNHAQGVALAAKLLGIAATVFMPETGSIAKIQATKGYGADVILDGKTYDEAVIAATSFSKRSGAIYISAYDDDAVIAGQGTIGLELLAYLPDLDTVVIPIGGGGLFAGIAATIKSIKSSVRIIGVQSEGADSAVKSFREGRIIQQVAPIETICDGIAIKAPSERTFKYIQSFADELVTVSDSAVASALLVLLERMKLVVEPSGAAGLAALMSGRAQPHGKTAVVLCGGNIDLKLLSDLIQRELIKNDRYLHVFTSVSDKPGSLASLLDVIATQRGNIISVQHNRISPHVPLGHTGVELLIEIRDYDHQAKLLSSLAVQGYSYKLFDQI
jgi:threonine dehydratase